MEESKVKRTGKPTAVSPPTPEEQLRPVFQSLAGVLNESNRELTSEKVLENVAIFIDYDNVYWSLLNNYNHNPDHELPEKNLFHKLWEEYGQDYVRTFRVYADFEKIKSNLTRLQHKRVQIRHVYSNGKDGDSRKNASDIELCIDAIENTYKDPSISCYVFVTADSDMIPIMSRLMYKGKRVELFSLAKSAPKYIKMNQYAHKTKDLVQFLNIEEREHDRSEISSKILTVITEWHDRFGKSADRYLGTSWLKTDLIRKLGVPADLISELLEELKQEGFIEEQVKLIEKGPEKGKSKNQIACTVKGEERIKVASI
ncbi:NYN domain-containing protein [Bacillus safensis]|uniref:NYN domain-containing protein n=1 Tax=Bacillus safensis TaxID=561879 RepID=UPI000DCEF859|nr:NYN domain-containing protein [Bacillus safensis]RAU57434.1 NYN domain-containing protein [Bacillus safensis]